MPLGGDKHVFLTILYPQATTETRLFKEALLILLRRPAIIY